MASLSDVADYKRAKEAFVSDNAGDSVWNINKVCWTAIVRGLSGIARHG